MVSQEVIERMSVYLEQLYTAGDNIVIFPTQISNKLHQALNAAKVLHHPRYRKLRQQWTIKKGEQCYCIPKSIELPDPKKPFPKFSEVVNPLALIKKIT
jgi:hypothetical protein